MAGAYRIEQVLSNTPRSRVERAVSILDGARVILKSAAHEGGSVEARAGAEHQFNLHRLLEHPNVVRALAVESTGEVATLVLEDFGGISLKQLCGGIALGASQFFRIAIPLTRAVAFMHERLVIHKDINPHNVIVDRELTAIKLGDFGIASRLSREQARLEDSAPAQGSLPYMAPEQSGRINRMVDARSDLYSLGATFYELLAGRPPFDGNDPKELVYCHVARQPTPLSQLLPALPPPLDAIVLRLLAKTPEERYESAAGVLADLEFCRDALDGKADIAAFRLGARDASPSLNIPQRVYGRSAEVAHLIALFQGVAAGASSCVQVRGLSGIGKTSVVQEVQRPVVQRHGLFGAGKFDATRSGAPYSALLSAVAALVRQVLASPVEQIERWRAHVLAAAGPNGSLLTEVIPDLRSLIGEQPAAAALSVEESRNRFEVVFHGFLQALASNEHPLVLFIDDVQWADLATLWMLERLTAERAIPYLMLNLAYRDNEVGTGHPLRLVVERLAQSGSGLTTIEVGPLPEAAIGELLRDCFRAPPADLAPLIDLVQRKTGGNPFFIGHWLRQVHADGLIQFDYAAGRWRWNLAELQARDATANVAELVANKLTALTTAEQKIVGAAALLGSVFHATDLDALAVAEPKAVRTLLFRLSQQGFLEPLENAHLLDTAGETATRVVCRFAHDRVRQAALDLLSATDEMRLHLAIGQVFRATGDERAAEAIGHLNAAAPLITSAAEREHLAALNLHAAQRAKQSAAYDAAFDFARRGLEALPEGAWGTNHNLSLELRLAAAEAAYICNQLSKMDGYCDEVLANCRDPLERARAYEVRSIALAGKDMPRSIDLSFQALSELGVKLPRQAGVPALLLAFSRLARRVDRTGGDDLRALPECTDPRWLMVLRLLLRAQPPAYNTSPTLAGVIVARQLEVTLEHGMSANSSFVFMCSAVWFRLVFGNAPRVGILSELGRALMARADSRPDHARTLALFSGWLVPWRGNLHDNFDSAMQTYRAGVETGDYLFAGAGAIVHGFYSVFLGRPLQQVVQEIRALAQWFGGVGDLRWRYGIAAVAQMAANLRGEAADPSKLRGTDLDPDEALAYHAKANNRTSQAEFHSFSCVLATLFGDFVAAQHHARLARPLLDAIQGVMAVPVFWQYYGIALFRSAGSGPLARRTRRLAVGSGAILRLRRCAKEAPAIYRHREVLLLAERDRVLGAHERALRRYD
jgi:predicted ATPase